MAQREGRTLIVELVSGESQLACRTRGVVELRRRLQLGQYRGASWAGWDRGWAQVAVTTAELEARGE